jgi:hypothetical protein
MLREFNVVFRDYNMKSLIRIVNFNEFQDLKIVLVDIICESERTDVYDIYIGVFD